MPALKRALFGDRPTGRLHLGHWVGVLANWGRLQSDHELFVVVADYHGLTTHSRRQDVVEMGENIRELVLDYLAAGIDPEKATIYLQSLVPEVAELHLLLSMLVPVPRLKRVPTLKGIMRNQRIERPSLGLLAYPVLQTADILLSGAERVLIGRDQAPHVEVTREVARRFNHLYGELFPEPEALIGDTMVGIDGKTKMSKTLGNAIFLAEKPESMREKVMSTYSDPTRIHPTDPGQVEGNPVFVFHDLFNDDEEEVHELKERYRKGRVADVEVKKRLVAALERFLRPMRERRARYEGRSDVVVEIIREGSRRARREAQETLRQARQAMGLIYYEHNR